MMPLRSRQGPGISPEIETTPTQGAKLRTSSRQGPGISPEIETEIVIFHAIIPFKVARGLASRLRLKQPLRCVPGWGYHRRQGPGISPEIETRRDLRHAWRW